jgi:cardiolipin hydrolase
MKSLRYDGGRIITLIVIIAVVEGLFLWFTASSFANTQDIKTITTTVSPTIKVITETITTTVAGGGVEAICFSRVEQCDDVIAHLIGEARKSIYVAIYSFTRDGLARALIDAKNRGVEVKVIMEEENAYGQGSDYRMLKEAGVDIRLDGNPALMHHKFAVIDGELVVTGSYNWSTAAEDRNDENFVVIRDRHVAEAFTQEFNRLWSQTIVG